VSKVVVVPLTSHHFGFHENALIQQYERKQGGEKRLRQFNCLNLGWLEQLDRFGGA